MSRCDVKQTSQVDYRSEVQLTTYQCKEKATHEVRARGGEVRLCCDLHVPGWRSAQPSALITPLGPSVEEVTEAIESIRRAVRP